ncbi:MAG: YHS domain-containing (seleno)protein [Bryobacteraceae bacterium]
MTRRNFFLALVPPLFTDRNGIAIRGYDPVAYFTLGQPTKGRPAFAHAHGGATFHFATAEHRELFRKHPEKYLPQYGGYCAWAVSNNYTAPIDPQAWKIVDKRLYLNYSLDVQRKWAKELPQRIQAADRNWPQLHK